MCEQKSSTHHVVTSEENNVVKKDSTIKVVCINADHFLPDAGIEPQSKTVTLRSSN